MADVAIQSKVHTVLEDAVLNYASESIAAALTDPAVELTLFAPTDEAFTALLASNDEWNSLADIPQETLDAVLLNHVVAGEVTSDMLENGLVETLGRTFITVDADNLMIDDANIVEGADILTPNGAVHVIDVVLVPQQETETSLSNLRDNNDLVVFPNPAENIVSIKGDFEATLVEFFDATGRLVKSTNITHNINVSNLESGIYTVVLSSGSNKSQTRVVIR